MKWIREHVKIHVLIMGLCIIAVSALIFVTSYIRENKCVYEGKYISEYHKISDSKLEPEYNNGEYEYTVGDIFEMSECDTEVKSILTVKETGDGVLLELEESEKIIDEEEYTYNHYSFPVISNEDVNNNEVIEVVCETDFSIKYARVLFSRHGIFISIEDDSNNLILGETTSDTVYYSRTFGQFNAATLYTREGYDIDKTYGFIMHILVALYILLWIAFIVSLFASKKVMPCGIGFLVSTALSVVISLMCFGLKFEGKYYFTSNISYLYDLEYSSTTVIVVEETEVFNNELYLIPDRGSESDGGYYFIYSPKCGDRDRHVILHSDSASGDRIECPKYLTIPVSEDSTAISYVEAGMTPTAYFSRTVSGMDFTYNESNVEPIFKELESDKFGVENLLGIIVLLPCAVAGVFFLIRYIKWRKYVKLHPYMPYGRYIIKGVDYLDESFSYMKKYLETQRIGEIIEILPELFLNNDERIDNPVYNAISKEKVTENAELFGFKRINDGLYITDSEENYTDSEIYYSPKKVYLASKAGDRIVAVFRLGEKYET